MNATFATRLGTGYYHNMSDVQIGQRLECRRCRHAWNTRTERRPVQCPKCKSTGWETDRVMLETANGWIERDELWRIQRETDWSKIPAFGAWADRTETDEEILAEMRRGWGTREEDDDGSYS